MVNASFLSRINVEDKIIKYCLLVKSKGDLGELRKDLNNYGVISIKQLTKEEKLRVLHLSRLSGGLYKCEIKYLGGKLSLIEFDTLCCFVDLVILTKSGLLVNSFVIEERKEFLLFVIRLLQRLFILNNRNLLQGVA